jgi:hypothetical protein
VPCLAKITSKSGKLELIDFAPFYLTPFKKSSAELASCIAIGPPIEITSVCRSSIIISHIYKAYNQYVRAMRTISSSNIAKKYTVHELVLIPYNVCHLSMLCFLSPCS